MWKLFNFFAARNVFARGLTIDETLPMSSPFPKQKKQTALKTKQTVLQLNLSLGWSKIHLVLLYRKCIMATLNPNPSRSPSGWRGVSIEHWKFFRHISIPKWMAQLTSTHIQRRIGLLLCCFDDFDLMILAKFRVAKCHSRSWNAISSFNAIEYEEAQHTNWLCVKIRRGRKRKRKRKINKIAL